MKLQPLSSGNLAPLQSHQTLKNKRPRRQMCTEYFLCCDYVSCKIRSIEMVLVEILCYVSLPHTKMDLYIFYCIWDKERCWCLNLLSFHYFYILVCVKTSYSDFILLLPIVHFYHKWWRLFKWFICTHFYLMMILVSWLLGHLSILLHGFGPAPIICVQWWLPTNFLSCLDFSNSYCL